tara:strand:+ start:3143 stop:3535 length:393 start_codon:yes stop_codon:yes gene_type:complete
MSYCGISKCGENSRNTYDSARSSFDEAAPIKREYEHHCSDIDIDGVTYDDLLNDIDGVTYDDLLNRNQKIISYDRELTPLDKFLKIRGLERYSDKFRRLGAKTVKDLKYLDTKDFIEIGITKKQLLIKIE